MTKLFKAIAVIFLALAMLAGPVLAIPQLLIDMTTGEVLYEEDAGHPWHPASLTKLMTAYLTFEAIAEGRVRLDTPVIISAHALAAPPSKIGAPVDTAYALEDALYLLIVKSANDIAIAIAETVSGTETQFVAEMNRAAYEMGMSATHFVNPNGLHDPAQVTSARDLAILSLAIRSRYRQYDGLFETGSVKLGKARLRSYNSLLTHFRGTTGMKTGYVCSSGLNIVATVQRQGRSLMAIVLGGSSSRERGELAAEMVVNGLSGRIRGGGKNVVSIVNRIGLSPSDMRPFICGKEAKAYVAKRAVEIPFGLEGEFSYLTDDVVTPSRTVSSLGRVRSVPVPRPRPLWAPAPTVGVAASEQIISNPVVTQLIVPIPRPRPLRRAEMAQGSALGPVF